MRLLSRSLRREPSSSRVGLQHLARAGRIAALSAIGFALATTSGVPSYAQVRHGAFTCAHIMAMQDFSIERNGVTVNNFQIREAVGVLSGSPYAQLTLTAVNRNAQSVSLSIQFVALAEKTFVLAMSGAPSFDIVGAQASERISISNNISADEFATVDRFCARIDGNF